MTVQSAVEELEELASGHDPIIHRGEDTTPLDLADRYGYDCLASAFRISYFSLRNGKVSLLKNGTLGGMIRDRRRSTPPFKKHPCPTCGRKR